MEEIYFENEFAKVFYDPALDSVFLEYKTKVPTHQDFIFINEKLRSCFRQRNTQKFVADIRKLGIISPHWQQWVAEMLIPNLAKHLKGKPLIHAQLFDKQDIMVKVSADGVKNRSNETLEDFVVHQFDNREDLVKFLESF